MLKAISLLLLSFCATKPTQNFIVNTAKEPVLRLEPVLVGKWKGSEKKSGQKRDWTIERYNNSIFQLTNYIDGKLYNQEFGIWTSDKVNYSTTTIGFISGNEITEGLFNESYEILKLNNHLFKYKNKRNGNIFTVYKIPQSSTKNPKSNPNFSDSAPSSELFNQSQLMVIDLLLSLQNGDPQRSYNITCTSSEYSFEEHQNALANFNKLHGFPEPTHYIKFISLGLRTINTQMHPIYIFWIKSKFKKENTFLRVEISYFKKNNPCLLAFFPVTFEADKIPENLK